GGCRTGCGVVATVIDRAGFARLAVDGATSVASVSGNAGRDVRGERVLRVLAGPVGTIAKPRVRRGIRRRPAFTWGERIDGGADGLAVRHAGARIELCRRGDLRGSHFPTDLASAGN